MSFYKCGHDRTKIFMDNNEVSFVNYEIWRETDGFDGDKSKCFKCYLNSEESEK